MSWMAWICCSFLQATDKKLIAAEVVQHQSSHESEELASAMEEIYERSLCQEYRSSPEFAQEVGPVKPQKLVWFSYEHDCQPLDAVQRLVDQM